MKVNTVDMVLLKKLLTLREGRVESVYKDSLGYPTAGIGHLLTGADKRRYAVGDPVPAALVDSWFEQDVKRFIDLTLRHIEQLGILKGYPEFVVALCSANFQLGNFKAAFPNTFNRIKAGNIDAAVQAVQRSLWARQTPTRTKDFVMGLRSLDVATAAASRAYFDKIRGE